MKSINKLVDQLLTNSFDQSISISKKLIRIEQENITKLEEQINDLQRELTESKLKLIHWNNNIEQTKNAYMLNSFITQNMLSEDMKEEFQKLVDKTFNN